MPYPILTLEDLHRAMIADTVNRFEDPDVSAESDTYIRTRIVAGAVTDCHAHIFRTGKDVMPDTAKDEMLDRWLAIKGLARRGATYATKSAALRATGTGSSVIPINTTLTDPATGLQYKVSAAGTIGVSAVSVDLDIVAVTAGSQSKLLAGAEIQFDSPPSGVQATAVLVKDLDEGGQDREENGEASARLLARMAEPIRGGTLSDYRSWGLESSSEIDTVHVYPNRNGLGSVDVAALKAGTGSARFLDSTERDALEDYLADRAPANISPAQGTLRVLETVEEPTDIKVRVEPTDAHYEFDWDDQTPPTVLSWTASTRTLRFNAARPTTMTVGDRLVIEHTGGTGEQLVIESLSSTDSVVLREAPSFTPSAADVVYAGGPLVDAVRDALIEHINSLGPTLGDFGQGWLGALLLSSIFKTAQLTDGVLDSDIETPTSNVELDDTEFPDATQVSVITPGQVIVRRWWG